MGLNPRSQLQIFSKMLELVPSICDSSSNNNRGRAVSAMNWRYPYITVLALGVGLASFDAFPVMAQQDFTFRRVTPPKSGVTRRITVQVSPSAPSSPAAPSRAGSSSSRSSGASAAAPAAQAPAELAWFWDGVSPKIDQSGPGSLQQAIDYISAAPGGKTVPTPRLQTMQDIAKAHGIDILKETIGTRVSPALVLSVIAIESAGRAEVTSSAGAQGLMQLMPATAERFGVTNRADPSENIKGGVAYLDWLMQEFSNDVVMVLASYNAGENAVKRNEGVPPYKETQNYVPKVLAAWIVARGLCVTPPEVATDGCVFAVNGG